MKAYFSAANKSINIVEQSRQHQDKLATQKLVGSQLKLDEVCFWEAWFSHFTTVCIAGTEKCGEHMNQVPEEAF